MEQGDRGQRLGRRRVWPVLPAGLYLLAGFVAPLLVLLALSGFRFHQGLIVPTLTAESYLRLVRDPFYLRIIARTFGIAVVVTGLSVLLGYPVAYALVRYPSRIKPLYILMVVAPLLIGGVVRGYGWLLLLDKGGLVNVALLKLGLVRDPIELLFNATGLVVAMVEVLVPFFILSLLGVLRNIDPMLEAAARSLGATAAQTFWRVTFPLSLGGVVAGASIVFSLAASIFVIPRIVGGPSYLLLSTLAYQQIQTTGNWPFGAAVSMAMLASTLLVLLVVQRVARRRLHA